MEIKKDWDPKLYLKFRNERTQPSIDLVNRISIDFSPENVIDFGCGPGNSSQVLVQKWPSCQLIGVDSSAAMIAKAKNDHPNQEWIVADAASYSTELKFDIVFSNATIQWIPDHKNLLAKFQNLLSDRGVMAIQIPLFWEMPMGKLIERVAKSEKWKSKTSDASSIFTIHDPSFYYEELSKLFKSIEIWQTHYFHILDSQSAILDMIISTGLRPYLDRLDNDTEVQEFEEAILEETKKEYPLQNNGKVLFPFNRLFFIGYK